MAKLNKPVAPEEIVRLVHALSKEAHADVMYYNGPVNQGGFDAVHEALAGKSNKKPNIVLFLSTYGGDPHAAYLIGRELQLSYSKISVVIAGDCYSAGTLLVLSAHEVVISDRGRLGPLDVQIIKRDELNERVSGMTMSIAMQELENKAFGTFLKYSYDLKDIFKVALSFRTALEVASNLTIGLYSEVYKQLDPIRIGEDARAQQIADHYGKLLDKKPQNLKQGAMSRLREFYPSHQCVIDRDEAMELFKNVRQPSEGEAKVIAALADLVVFASPDNVGCIVLSDIPDPGENHESKENTPDHSGEPDTGGGEDQPGAGEVPAKGNGSTGNRKQKES